MNEHLVIAVLKLVDGFKYIASRMNDGTLDHLGNEVVKPLAKYLGGEHICKPNCTGEYYNLQPVPVSMPGYFSDEWGTKILKNEDIEILNGKSGISRFLDVPTRYEIKGTVIHFFVSETVTLLFDIRLRRYKVVVEMPSENFRHEFEYHEVMLEQDMIKYRQEIIAILDIEEKDASEEQEVVNKEIYAILTKMHTDYIAGGGVPYDDDGRGADTVMMSVAQHTEYGVKWTDSIYPVFSRSYPTSISGTEKDPIPVVMDKHGDEWSQYLYWLIKVPNGYFVWRPYLSLEYFSSSSNSNGRPAETTRGKTYALLNTLKGSSAKNLYGAPIIPNLAAQLVYFNTRDVIRTSSKNTYSIIGTTTEGYDVTAYIRVWLDHDHPVYDATNQLPNSKVVTELYNKEDNVQTNVELVKAYLKENYPDAIINDGSESINLMVIVNNVTVADCYSSFADPLHRDVDRFLALFEGASIDINETRTGKSIVATIPDDMRYIATWQ